MSPGRPPAIRVSTAVRQLRRASALTLPVALVALGLVGLAPAASAATTPRLTVTQTVSPTTFDRAGQVLTWSSKVTDAGSTALQKLAVTDASSRLPARTCTPTALGGTLAAGASTTCTTTYTVTQSDLDTHADRVDAVTASATADQGGTRVKATASATASAATAPGLSLSATASPASVSREGQRIAYTFLARNKGDETLRGLLVRAAFAGSALVCSPVALGGSLAPGASTICRATRTTGLADLKTTTLSSTAKATGTTSTRAINAAASVAVAVKALAPRPVEGADDSTSTVLGGPTVILPGSTNDLPGEAGGPAIDPSRTELTGYPPCQFCGGATDELRNTPKHVTTSDGSQWWVRPDGSVRAQPATPVATIDYRVYDTAGHSAVGHLRVTAHPGATCPNRDLSVSHPTSPGQPVTFDPLAACDPGQNPDGTKGAFDPRSVLMTVSVHDTDASLSYDHKHLRVTEASYDQVANTYDLTQVGDFTVNADGTVTFAPAPGFEGTVPEVLVAATSNAGVDVVAEVDGIEVSGAPGAGTGTGSLIATDDHGETTSGTPVTLAGEINDVNGSGLLNPFETFPSDQLTRLPAGSTVGDRDTTLTVPGEGVYAAQGLNVVLTPAKDFVGHTTPVQYEISDTNGNTARATLTVTVDPLPVARADAVTTPQNHAVTVDVSANDDPGSSAPPVYAGSFPEPRLPVHGLPKGWKGSVEGTHLTVPGQGAYVVNLGTETVTFTPEPQFSGTTTPITLDFGEYEHLGQVVFDQEVTSTLTVRVTASNPHAVDDAATTGVGRPVVVPVLSNDTAGPGASLVGSSVRLRLAPGLPSGSALYSDAKTLTVPGRGAFLVSGDGEITFVPIGSKPGPAPLVGYQVADTNGTTTRGSVKVTVR